MSGCQRKLAATFSIGMCTKKLLRNNVESVDKNKYSCYYKKTERTLFYK